MTFLYSILGYIYIRVLLFTFSTRWVDRTAPIIYQPSDDIDSHFIQRIYINAQALYFLYLLPEPGKIMPSNLCVSCSIPFCHYVH